MATPQKDSVHTVLSCGAGVSEVFHDDVDFISQDIVSHVHYNAFECVASVLRKLVVEGERMRADGHQNGSQYDVFNRFYSRNHIFFCIITSHKRLIGSPAMT